MLIVAEIVLKGKKFKVRSYRHKSAYSFIITLRKFYGEECEITILF